MSVIALPPRGFAVSGLFSFAVLGRRFPFGPVAIHSVGGHLFTGKQ
jgi:hypothetical protein